MAPLFQKPVKRLRIPERRERPSDPHPCEERSGRRTVCGRGTEERSGHSGVVVGTGPATAPASHGAAARLQPRGLNQLQMFLPTNPPGDLRSGEASRENNALPASVHVRVQYVDLRVCALPRRCGVDLLTS